jgi:hypothetical protein
VVAALDPLRELHLLRGREQGHLADVLEEELQRVGRDLGLDLGLYLDLDLVVVASCDDRDLGLVERSVELVQLARLELELVERERDLVRVQPPGLGAGLEQALGLVGREDVLDPRPSGRAPTGRTLRFACGQTAPFLVAVKP